MQADIHDHPMVTRQLWENFTEVDHATWKLLFERQAVILKNRACDEIIQGMETLNICNDKIPKIEELNAILKKETDFSIVAVKGFIPEYLFFKFLSERKFPSTCFIRKQHQLDYLEEPDIFHDVFGHVPLLVNPIFADFMEEFGRKGLESIELGLLSYAAALYWFTVEFGLIKTKEGIRIYGAGITSSKGESIYCLESDIPARIKYNMFRTMKTNYHIDSFQKSYFVIENYDELFKSVRNLDWREMQEALKQFPQIDQGIYVNELEKVTKDNFMESIDSTVCLIDKSCIPCMGGVPPLDITVANKLLAEVGNGWKINEAGHLFKEYKFDDFMGPLAFANKIAELAEAEAHHPDIITIAWGKCSIEIWTHKINGLAESDFILAAKIQEIK